MALALWSARVQKPLPLGYIGLEEYWRLADQFSTGEKLHGEVPFAYRVAVPWMASRLAPHALRSGFLVVNVLSGILVAPLLVAWLAVFVRRVAIRMAMVVVYAATWLNAVRYPFSNPVYVDPPFIVLMLIAFLSIQSLKTRSNGAACLVLSMSCVAGTLVRETMLLVPIAWLFARHPVGIPGARVGRPSVLRLPPPVCWVPLIASIATVVVIHSIVEAEGTRTFGCAALQWLHKPLSSFALSWLTVFGPLVALLLYDWRRTLRFLSEQQDFLAFLVAGASLALIGGADTERFLCWLMPAMYVLIGMSMERHWSAIISPPIAVSLIACQAVAARVFWPIPDVDGGTPTPLGAASTIGSRLYGVLNRLFVLDDFYWNLWSSFGSPTFRLLRLGIYAGAVLLFILAIHRRELASPRAPDSSSPAARVAGMDGVIHGSTQ